MQTQPSSLHLGSLCLQTLALPAADPLVASTSLVLRALTIILAQGPLSGFYVNLKKCELFGVTDLSSFPPSVQTSNQPNIKILGAPIGDAEFCQILFSSKHQVALALLSTISDLGSVDPKVALVLLHLCSSFCKHAHIARAMPPHLILGSMEKFDADIRRCFADCTGVDVPDSAWRQAQLSLRRGGFGLRSLALHLSAAYIASLCGSDDVISTPHLANAITHLQHLCCAFRFPVN